MGKRLTYEQKVYRIEQKYKKKEYDLKMRIKIKYEEKIEKEFEKKRARMEKQKEVELHNLKVIEGEAHPLAKIRKKKPKKSSVKDSTRLWFSRMVRIKLSRKKGSEYVVNCYTHKLSQGGELEMVVVERTGKRFVWGGVQPGHQVKKGQGESLKFYEPVIRCQCYQCNVKTGHDQHKREMKRKEEVGQEVYDEAIRVKGTTFDMSIEEMIELREKCKKYVKQKLEELKK